MVVYAFMQAEASIAELIYLVCVFTIVTDLVFNHPGRVYETTVFELISSLSNNERFIPR